MMRYRSTVPLLLFCWNGLERRSEAWAPSPTFVSDQLRTPTFLAAEPPTPDHHHQPSRRQWFSQVGSAAVAVIGGTSAANAAPMALALEKPIAPSLCDSAISVWQNPDGRRIYLLGTAHISSMSAELAGQLVRDVKPDAVFVELDAKRVGRPAVAGGDIVVGSSAAANRAVPVNMVLTTPPPPALSGPVEVSTIEDQPVAPPPSPPPRFSLKLDLRQRALQAGSAAVGGAIKGMYSKLNDSGFNAGEEFVVAVREGQKIGAAIVLGDRDVEVTLRRLTEALSKTDLKTLMSPDSELEKSMKELMPGPPPSMDMNDDTFRQEMSLYVETMKAKDNVRKIMAELKKSAPLIYEALVEERDVFMASALNSLDQFPSIVAVMGIAHMEGVENKLQSLGWRQVPLRCPRN